MSFSSEAVLRDEPEVLALYRQELHGPLAEHGGDRTNESKKEQGYTVTFNEQRGNNSAYLQARIQRDCPGELEAVKRVKFQQRKRFPLLKPPQDFACRILCGYVNSVRDFVTS